MDPLRIAIVDDEPDSVKLLSLQLKQFTDVELCGAFTNPAEALDKIEALELDCVFLDIEMPVINGFEFIEKIKHLGLNFVFITAYNQFALKAFRINALDYLLKPVDEADLKTVIEKAMLRKKPTEMQISMLQKQLRGEPVNKIAIPSQHGVIFINMDDILYAEASSNYSILIMKDKKKILLSKSLKEVQDVLEDSHFLRIHRQYIINLNHIMLFNKNDNIIKMNNDKELPVARTQKQFLIDKFRWL